MKKLILCLLLICGVDAQALPKVDESKVLVANFKQSRHLKDLPKPLVSEGFMVLKHGNGMVWSTTAPFPSSILITSDGLYQLENGVKTTIITAGAGNPMFDIMSGELNVAHDTQIKGFTLEKMPADRDKWRVRLIPDHSQTKNFIQSITIEGDKWISHITIARPNGDYDDITITDHTLKNTVPRELRVYFGQ